MASHFLPATTTPRMLSPSNTSRPSPPERTRTSFSLRASLSTNSVSPFPAGTLAREFSGLKIRPDSLKPLSPSLSTSRAKRSVVTMAIRARRPFNKFDYQPPDLESYYFQHRIVLFCAPLFAEVYELILQELLYLAYESTEDPVYMYINSTGTMRGDQKLGREREALAILDNMSWLGPPIFTLCIGHAWGEAALILASGKKGHRTALPSSTIMIREPIDRFQGQASSVERSRRVMKILKEDMVEALIQCTGHTKEQIETDIRRPKYFSASEAVEYGLIDKVLVSERAKKGRGVLPAMEGGKPVTSGSENVK